MMLLTGIALGIGIGFLTVGLFGPSVFHRREAKRIARVTLTHTTTGEKRTVTVAPFWQDRT